MTITPEERDELFKTIYKIQEGDELIAAAQMIHPTSAEIKAMVEVMSNMGNRLSKEAWKKIMKMTGFPEGADMP